jgi:diaminohydroxyphosphoribosylaminopyrimidine deaminase/5-amino-6-(5-phosphoribosylamino)uracil reductase
MRSIAMAATEQDVSFMARALRLAERGRDTTRPNPRVGCVLQRDGVVVGEGYHRFAGAPHAEVEALRAAGEAARGSTAYVTLEPCCHFGRTAPCVQALLAAGVSRVVAAMPDPNPLVAGKGLAQLRGAGVDVTVGVLEREARELNIGFVSRMERGRPWVRCKVAMTLDGRTATAAGESQWITAEAARGDVQHWRARSGAIMTGIGTVLADDPQLTVRLPEWQELWGPSRSAQPLRVVMDSALRMSATARMLAAEGETLIFTRCQADLKREALIAAGATVLATEAGGARVDLAQTLQCLASREVNEVLVEAGPQLSGALLARGLVDELLLYVAPSLLGDGGRGAFHLPTLSRLGDRLLLDIVDIRAVGRDWRLIARPSLAAQQQ